MSTGKRVGLSREKVLRAALGLVERDGVEKLSMRRLGAELGVEAMTLYHYVPNKGALLDGLVELVVCDVRAEFAGPPEQWPRRLREFAVRFRAGLLRCPGVIPLVATRPAGSAEALRAVESAAADLVAAGIAPVLALRVINSVTTLVIGHCLAEAGSTPGHGGAEPVADVDPADFPVLAAAVAGGLGSPEDHRDRFELALDALLTGLAAAVR